MSQATHAVLRLDEPLVLPPLGAGIAVLSLADLGWTETATPQAVTSDEDELYDIQVNANLRDGDTSFGKLCPIHQSRTKYSNRFRVIWETLLNILILMGDGDDRDSTKSTLIRASVAHLAFVDRQIHR